MAISDDQYEALMEELQKNRKLSEDIQRNWNLDREDFNEFKNRLGHAEQEIKSFREILNKLPESIKQQVAESLKPVQKEIQDLKGVIDKKKMLAIPVNKLKKRWYEFWRS